MIKVLCLPVSSLNSVFPLIISLASSDLLIIFNLVSSIAVCLQSTQNRLQLHKMTLQISSVSPAGICTGSLAGYFYWSLKIFLMSIHVASTGPMKTFWINGWDSPSRLSSLGTADISSGAPPANCHVALTVVTSEKPEFFETDASSSGCNKAANNCNCNEVDFTTTASREAA